MEYNLQKYWITMLYTWNQHNIMQTNYTSIKEKSKYKTAAMQRAVGGCRRHTNAFITTIYLPSAGRDYIKPPSWKYKGYKVQLKEKL